jgi:hypothetical protein
LFALYSKLGRERVNAARAFAAEQGFAATPDGIRHGREEILRTPMKSVAGHGDYFNISGCRDLLFHVQEQQFALCQIATLFYEHKLQFVVSALHPAIAAKYKSRFPEDAAITNLVTWEAFETKTPLRLSGCISSGSRRIEQDVARRGRSSTMP